MTLAQRLESMRQIAYEWHGGQDSPLYSFASTGKVWGEEHRRALLLEIQECENVCHEGDGDGENGDDLARLRRYIDSIVF